MRHERMLPALSDGELESTLVRGKAEESAFLAWWLSVLVEFDRRGLWQAAGFASCVAWLMAKCGDSPRTARDHLRVAHRLEEAPRTRAAFAEGRLSYSKVRALCRVVRPDNDEFLVGLALDLTASQLERHVQSYEATERAATMSAEDLARREAMCGVTTWTDPSGLVHHEVVTPPEEGMIIDRAIEYGREMLYRRRRAEDKAARAEGLTPPVRPEKSASERRFDGLVWALKRGFANAERDPGPVEEPFLFVFHLREDTVIDSSGAITMANGLRLSPSMVERMGCASLLQSMRVDGEDRPLDLGRTSRVASRKQKVALSARHETCAFPGCELPIRWCEFHHVEWWGRDQGRTDLANLRPLCRHHHGLVHEGGWHLVLESADGAVVAISPTGRRVTASWPLTEEAVSHEALVARLDDLGYDFDDPTRLSGIGGRWEGERLTPWARAEVGAAIANACKPPPSSSRDNDEHMLAWGAATHPRRVEPLAPWACRAGSSWTPAALSRLRTGSRPSEESLPRRGMVVRTFGGDVEVLRGGPGIRGPRRPDVGTAEPRRR